MASWIALNTLDTRGIHCFVCTLLIRHAGEWLVDILCLGLQLTTCYNGRRCILAKVVLQLRKFWRKLSEALMLLRQLMFRISLSHGFS